MNIGYVYGFNSTPPQTGGGVHVFNLVQSLTALGCKVHAFEPEINPECIVYPKSDIGIEKFIKNIDLLYIRIDGWYLTSEQWKLKCMDKAATIPIVWEINAGIEERLMLRKSSGNNNSGNRVTRWLEKKRDDINLRSIIRQENVCRRRYASSVNAAICVSEENARYAAEELGIGNCRVVPNGSNPALFSPEKENKDTYINYKGYLKVIYSGDSGYPWQGFQYVRNLASLAQKKGDKIFFIALDNSASGSSIESDNLLRCKVEYSKVPEYLASADICLCVYDVNEFTHFKYGFNLSPLKLFDYMASGKPVIGTRLGQIGSVIEDGKEGFLTSNDINDIYEKLLFCQRNRDKAEQMGAQAREKVLNRYNWDRAARDTYELFRSLI